MADQGRPEPHPIAAAMDGQDPIAAAIARLGHAPSFARAMRSLEAAVQSSGRTLRPTGTTGAPAEEAVLFRAVPSLGFAPADIGDIRKGQGAWPVEMDVAFLGLYGPASPLPASWTERIVMNTPGADNVRDVLDLFDHPLIGLSWRIWRSGRVDWLWDGAGRDVPSVAALALAGIVPGTTPKLDPLRLLPLAGLLAQYDRGAATVAAIVADYFEVPAHIEEWIPGRATIPEPQRFRLGGAASILGDASLGETVPDIAGTVRLVLGPLPLHVFMAFLPGGARRPTLHALLTLAVREPVRVMLDLVLEPNGVAGLALGASRLGWTSWSGGPGDNGTCPAGLA